MCSALRVDEYETPACCDKLRMNFSGLIHYAIINIQYFVLYERSWPVGVSLSATDPVSVKLSVKCSMLRRGT
jgi:hypothetical protein